jgi:hypothetical protein
MVRQLGEWRFPSAQFSHSVLPRRSVSSRTTSTHAFSIERKSSTSSSHCSNDAAWYSTGSLLAAPSSGRVRRSDPVAVGDATLRRANGSRDRARGSYGRGPVGSHRPRERDPHLSTRFDDARACRCSAGGPRSQRDVTGAGLSQAWAGLRARITQTSARGSQAPPR